MARGKPGRPKYRIPGCLRPSDTDGLCHPHDMRRRRGSDLERAVATNRAPIEHVLSEIVPGSRSAVCAKCGPTRIRRCGYNANGRQRWRCLAVTYSRYRGTSCESCGFTNPDVRMFDVHHVNHDHADNRPENLMTLCPNCHRAEHLGAVAVAVAVAK